MTSRTPPAEFKTSDLYFAAFLKTAGVMMLRTEKTPGTSRIAFVFDSTISDINELKASWFGDGKIAANAFSLNIKSLKSACHM